MTKRHRVRGRGGVPPGQPADNRAQKPGYFLGCAVRRRRVLLHELRRAAAIGGWTKAD